MRVAGSFLYILVAFVFSVLVLSGCKPPSPMACKDKIACTKDADCGGKCSCCKDSVCVGCNPAMEKGIAIESIVPGRLASEAALLSR